MDNNQIADTLDRLGFPTFASSVRREPEAAGAILYDFLNPPHPRVREQPGYRVAELLLRDLVRQVATE